MPDRIGSRFAAEELRRLWRDRSMTSGWAFPSDWYCPAVDALCEALSLDTDSVRPAAQRLGGDRARMGVALADALIDIDALADLVPASADPLRRSLSLGWADQTAAGADAVEDPLTGLSSIEYLQTRLKEIYRAGALRGEPVSHTHALVVVRLVHSTNATWVQTLPMVHVAQAMQTVFSADQSLVRMGLLVAAALTPRVAALGRQTRLLSDVLTARLGAGDGRHAPQVWIEQLPAGYTSACALLGSLRR